MKPLFGLELACGKCGKPRGRHHLCRGTRKGRDRVRVKAGFTCGTCKKRVKNPFTHTCEVRSDFKKRKAARARAVKAAERRRKAAARRAAERERRRQAAERRKAREREASRRRRAAARSREVKARAERHARKPRSSPHSPATCSEKDCTRYGCVKYQEGYVDGYETHEEEVGAR